jgi:hypothetical protein
VRARRLRSSGKTTLLNHILTGQHGKRIAVIENEFGEIDIDGSLVAAQANIEEDVLLLNNGCLCCTVRVPSGAPVATPGKLTLRRASAERSVALEACTFKRQRQT